MSTINVNCCGKRVPHPPFPTHCSICTSPLYLPLTELSGCSSPQFVATLRMRNYMIWLFFILIFIVMTRECYAASLLLPCSQRRTELGLNWIVKNTYMVYNWPARTDSQQITLNNWYFYVRVLSTHLRRKYIYFDWQRINMNSFLWLS